VYCKIYPLQVHTFEDRYYLVIIELGKAVAAENIKHFPIDRIHRPVDIALDDVSGASRSDSPVARNCAKTGGEIRIRLFVYDTPDVQNVFRK
jgi:hypothetical protein